MDFDLAVLGAGPAGVGAAYRAATSGRRVCVLERADRVGGAAGSFEIAGMRVDLGSHRLHPSTEPRILETLQGLLGDDLQTRPRHGRIRLADRWISFPLRARELVTRMPPKFVFGAGRDAMTAPFRRAGADTFEEILLAGLGRTICDGFYFPYARKIWGVEPAALSGEQARRRVTADSPGKIIRRIVTGSGSGGARGSGHFYYPRRGYGQISEALAAGAIEAGAKIELGTTVERVEVGDAGIVVSADDGRTFRSKRVWSTLPITRFASLVQPSPPEEVAAAISALRFRSMVLVYLVLPVARYTEFDAHYFPGAHTRMTRLSEPKNYRDSTHDPKDRTVLCAEIPCDRDDDVWSLSDRDLTEVVRAGCVASGLPDPREVGVHVVRLPSAYPIYEVGYERWFDRLVGWLDGLPNVLTFGRQGLFAHDNLHHALAMSWAAADALRGDGTFDDESWSAARARFAAHVVED